MLKIEGRKMIKGRAETQMKNSGGSNSSTIGMKIICKFLMCVSVKDSLKRLCSNLESVTQ